jgi:hypothetical protein
MLTRVFLVVALIVAAAASAAAQSASATLSANITPTARLSFSSNSLVFPDADPDLVPKISALSGPITITAKALAARDGVVTLTVQASDDLRSGVTVLPASMITWTATGVGFVPGTMSASTPQVVGSWTGSGVRTGTQTYYFENRWTHPSGIYTVTLVYTLTAP